MGSRSTERREGLNSESQSHKVGRQLFHLLRLADQVPVTIIWKSHETCVVLLLFLASALKGRDIPAQGERSAALGTEGVKGPSPERARHISPERARHISPERARHISPEKARHISPERARHISPGQAQRRPGCGGAKTRSPERAQHDRFNPIHIVHRSRSRAVGIAPATHPGTSSVRWCSLCRSIYLRTSSTFDGLTENAA